MRVQIESCFEKRYQKKKRTSARKVFWEVFRLRFLDLRISKKFEKRVDVSLMNLFSYLTY